MKRALLSCLVLGVLGQAACRGGSASPGTSGAAAPAAGELKGTVYGAGVKATETVAISRILAEPDAWAGKRVRVEGTITDVCSRRGCWIRIGGDKDGTALRFKVDDGVMTFPMSVKGKYVVAEGVVHPFKLTPEQMAEAQEHEAMERGTAAPAAAPVASAPAGPTVVVQLDGVGAVIRDAQ